MMYAVILAVGMHDSLGWSIKERMSARSGEDGGMAKCGQEGGGSIFTVFLRTSFMDDPFLDESPLCLYTMF